MRAGAPSPVSARIHRAVRVRGGAVRRASATNGKRQANDDACVAVRVWGVERDRHVVRGPRPPPYRPGVGGRQTAWACPWHIEANACSVHQADATVDRVAL